MDQHVRPPQSASFDILIHARPALHKGRRGFVWMSDADRRLTTSLPGETIEDKLPWKWVGELLRYTMPNCVFCKMCYDSTPCDRFLQAFREQTPPVVSSTLMSDGRRKIIAQQAALLLEYSIGRTEDSLLSDLGLQRASVGGWIEQLLTEAKQGLQGLVARRVPIPPHVLRAASEAFVNGVKVGVYEQFGHRDFDSPEGGGAHAPPVTPDQILAIRQKWMIADGAISVERVRQRFVALAGLAHPDQGGSDDAMRQLLHERELLLASLRA